MSELCEWCTRTSEQIDSFEYQLEEKDKVIAKQKRIMETGNSIISMAIRGNTYSDRIAGLKERLERIDLRYSSCTKEAFHDLRGDLKKLIDEVKQ